MFKPGPDTERLRQELESSNSWLFEDKNSRLRSALTAVCPGWKPDLLVVVEVDKTSDVAEPIVEVFSVRDYRRAYRFLTVTMRRKLELALEMLRQLEPNQSVD